MKKLLLLCILLISLKLSSQTLELLKDVCQPNCHYVVKSYQENDGKLYFRGKGFTNTNSTYPSLWRTDGTTPGTVKIAEHDEIYNTCVLNNKLFYKNVTVTQGAYYENLSYIDGNTTNPVSVYTNTNGTTVLRDIVSTSNRIFFQGYNLTTGMELWTSDGTAPGTHLVKDINLGANGTNMSSFIVINDKLYFIIESLQSLYDKQLWTSDGTNAGTFMLFDSVSVTFPITNGRNELNGELYFFGLHNGKEMLYKTNGTISGTNAVPVPQNKILYTPKPIRFKNYLYFVLSDPAGQYLYRTNGFQTDSVQILKRLSFVSPILQLFLNDGYQLSASSNSIYFIGNDSTSLLNNNSGFGLYETDMTEAGTRYIRSIYPYSSVTTYNEYHWSSIIYNGKLYFFKIYGTGTSRGFELWESDGSEQGTYPFIPIFYSPDITSDMPHLHVYNQSLYINAHLSNEGMEIWKYTTDANSVSNIRSANGISVYPNPAFDVLTVNSEEPILKIEVFDINGRNVLNETVSSFNISKLSSGLYFAKVHTEKGHGIIKFTKQ